MKESKVSIIIVVFNAREMLRRTLESVLSIEYSNVEVVVVDGGSTDGTLDLIKAYASRLGVWISEPDRGIYDAMNKGLRLATGDYVWFINAGDTLYDSSVLNDALKDRADIYYGDTLIVDQSGSVLGLRRKPLPRQLSWRSFLAGMVVCHQSIIVKRSIAPKYDLRYKTAADIEWVLAALKRADTVVNLNRILSVFEIGGESSRNRKLAHKERFLIMKRNFGLTLTLGAHLLIVLRSFGQKYRTLPKK